MNKPVLGLVLGGILGVFDGLSALVSAPEVAPEIVGIVVGSTFKGIFAGAIIGWIATRVQSQQTLLIAGLLVGAFFAFLIAALPRPDGTHYWWQIMLPGSVLGLIVGYATQRYGRSSRQGSTAAARSS
jgi:hypothetical protein